MLNANQRSLTTMQSTVLGEMLTKLRRQPRAMQPGGGGTCVYSTAAWGAADDTPDYRCGVGMFWTEAAIAEHGDFEGCISTFVADVDTPLDSLFPERYQGLGEHFWAALQNIHDADEFWKDHGTLPAELLETGTNSVRGFRHRIAMGVYTQHIPSDDTRTFGAKLESLGDELEALARVQGTHGVLRNTMFRCAWDMKQAARKGTPSEGV